MVSDSEKRTRFDSWLAGLCASRVFNGLVFMTYTGALFELRREWGMSAAQAGAVASGFQIGYAVSLVIFSSLADRITPQRVYLDSMFAAGVSSLGFALGGLDRGGGHCLSRKCLRPQIPNGVRCRSRGTFGLRRSPGLEQPPSCWTATIHHLGMGFRRAGAGRAGCSVGHSPIRQASQVSKTCCRFRQFMARRFLEL
jgi:hypothetical protein